MSYNTVADKNSFHSNVAICVGSACENICKVFLFISYAYALLSQLVLDFSKYETWFMQHGCKLD